ncbi:MAG TPA: CBS domain-containing protein [Methanobacterium sp.]|jgi:CBS domain-containing protein|nr:MAG: CBS domain-containing protein [Methanobacterium sp.]HPX77178.1 CBS domain-containing protein [Methanobacterium sp.]
MRKRQPVNLVKSMDRGSLEFKTRNSEHEGDVMSIARREVVTAPQSITIQEAAETMVKNKFRRLPITDPGTGKLLGIVTSMDILDFLGGGDKYKIIKDKYQGNFLAAVNDSVKEIMTREVHVLSDKDSVDDAIDNMIKWGVGALPVTDSMDKIVGIVSERDFVVLMAGKLTDELVEDYMTEKVISTTPGTRIEGASKIMVRNKLRRIPVIGEERKTPHPEKDKIVGIVTATDVMEFLGENKAFNSTGNAEEILNTFISDIMEPNVVSVAARSRLGDICQIMETKGMGGLPVVHGDELQGIITESDILRAFHG